MGEFQYSGLQQMTLSNDIVRLEKPVQFPADCIDVLRSRPFTFSARSCNRWNLGRVVLCGDAAHVMPPCTHIPKPHSHI